VTRPMRWWHVAASHLVRCRTCRVLTWKGRALVFAVFLLLAAAGVRLIHPFLAVSAPVNATVLAVEGWAPERTYIEVAELFRSSRSQILLIVVAVYEGDDLHEEEPGVYYDDYLRGVVSKSGIPQEAIHVLLCPATHRDRTYHSARVTRRWLDENRPDAVAINVATLGPHARRSRLLWQKAFEPGSDIGVVALQDKTYDASHWWRSSEGVRDVLSETLAYLYARLLFRSPPPADDDDLPFEIPGR